MAESATSSSSSTASAGAMGANGASGARGSSSNGASGVQSPASNGSAGANGTGSSASSPFQAGSSAGGSTGGAGATSHTTQKTGASASDSAAGPATSSPPTPTATPSKRDAFRSRVGARYADLNMDDEDAYYDQMGRMMDEYEGYEKSSRRMREAISKSPAMAEMLRAAQQTEGFDPYIWMDEQREEMDFDASRDDPEYAQKLKDARSKRMERKAAADKIVEDITANMPASKNAVLAKGRELGLSDEQVESTVSNMYQIMEDLVHGKIDVKLFEMLAKGATHDEDVAQAHDEGQAQGLSTRIDEHLRSGAGRAPKPTGRQAPTAERTPRPRSRNPFAHDEIGG